MCVQMPSLFELLSQSVGKSVGQLEQDAIRAWVEKEVDLIDHAVMELAWKYGVHSPDEMEEKIRAGKIDGHPAWEDAIKWENMEEYKVTLLGAVVKMHESTVL